MNLDLPPLADPHKTAPVQRKPSSVIIEIIQGIVYLCGAVLLSASGGLTLAQTLVYAHNKISSFVFDAVIWLVALMLWIAVLRVVGRLTRHN